MKTLTAALQQSARAQTVSRKNRPGLMAFSMGDIMPLSFAALATAAVITLAVWSAGMGSNPVLIAGTWAIGFIFLGLAVDSRGLSARLLTASGITLPVLSLLQDQVSPDFIILSGVLLAAWTGFAVLKLLSVQEIQ